MGFWHHDANGQLRPLFELQRAPVDQMALAIKFDEGITLGLPGLFQRSTGGAQQRIFTVGKINPFGGATLAPIDRLRG